MSGGGTTEAPSGTTGRAADGSADLAVHEFGFAYERAGSEGRVFVLWSDLRFCEAGLVCGRWFGGEFGPDDRALTQLVNVGEWIQTRPAPP